MQLTEYLHELAVYPLEQMRVLGHRQVVKLGQTADRRINPRFPGGQGLRSRHSRCLRIRQIRLHTSERYRAQGHGVRKDAPGGLPSAPRRENDR